MRQIGVWRAVRRSAARNKKCDAAENKQYRQYRIQQKACTYSSQGRQKHRTSDQSKEFRRPWVAERANVAKVNTVK